MSVYVDDARIPYGRLIMSHMMADSSVELDKMAGRIGVDRKWLQDAGTYREHFDVCLAKRRLAVAFGAIEVSSRELVSKIREKRKHDLSSRYR